MNSNIEFENTEYVKESNRIYQDDTIIAKAIEETLLDLYPINEQNSYFVQDNIKRETDDFILLKNKVLENIDYKNKLVKDIVEENSKFIFPITSNEKKKFEKIIIENNENNENNIINYEKEDVNEDKKESYKEFLINISENEKSYNLGNLTYEEYQKNLTKILNPYKSIENTNVGYNIFTNKVTNYLDLKDYDNDNFLFRRNIPPFFTYKDLKDENNKLIDEKEVLVVNGEQLNIVGFLICPYGSDNINYILNNDNLGDLKIIGNIESISNNKITIKNHGLVNNKKIQIIDSEYKPSINGNYDINVIDNNNIELVNYKSVDFIKKNGIIGKVLVKRKLNFKLYKIENDKDNFVIKDKTYQNAEQGKVVLFNDLIEKENINKSLEVIVPKIDNILGNNYPIIKNYINFKDINILLKGYGLTFNDLDYVQTNFVNNIINNNVDNLIKHLYKHDYNSNQKIDYSELFNDPKFIYADIYINNELIKKEFGEYILFETQYDNPFLRYNWVKENNEDYYLIAVNLIKTRNNNNKELKKNINEKYKNYSNELEKYKSQLDEIEKNQKYFKVDNECIKFNFKKIENSKNQNIDDLLSDEDKKAPIIITKDNETKLYEWNKNSWKEKKLNNYSKLNYLCNFKDKKIENINFDELDCLYKSSYGCRSRKFIRAKKRYENYLKVVNDLKENIDNIDNNQNEIEEKLENILKFVDKKYYVSEKENNKNINIKKSQDDEFGEYKKYINLINQLEDEEYRNYIIFNALNWI